MVLGCYTFALREELHPVSQGSRRQPEDGRETTAKKGFSQWKKQSSQRPSNPANPLKPPSPPPTAAANSKPTSQATFPANSRSSAGTGRSRALTPARSASP